MSIEQLEAVGKYFRGKSPHFVLCLEDKSPDNKHLLKNKLVARWPRPSMQAVIEHLDRGLPVGLVPGSKNLAVVDFDRGEDFLTPWCQKHDIPVASVQSTRGMHVYLRTPNAFAGCDGKISTAAVQADIRHRNGYIILRDIAEIAGFLSHKAGQNRFPEVLTRIRTIMRQNGAERPERVFGGSAGAFDSPEMMLGRNVFNAALKGEGAGWAVHKALQGGVRVEAALEIETRATDAARERLSWAWSVAGRDLLGERGRIRETYVAMVALSAKTGDCWASYPTIGKVAGVPEGTMQGHIERLERMGYIERVGVYKSRQGTPTVRFLMRKVSPIVRSTIKHFGSTRFSAQSQR